MATTSQEVDMELKKAFQKLQHLQLTNREKIVDMKQDMEKARRTRLVSKLTQSVLENLKPGQQTYVSVGRCFIQKDATKIKEELAVKIAKSQKDLEEFEKKIEITKNQQDEVEKEVREKINLKRDQMKWASLLYTKKYTASLLYC